MIGEDLGYRPGEVAQAKFEYFPLDKVFKKRLEEGIRGSTFGETKNVEDKHEEQLKKLNIKERYK